MSEARTFPPAVVRDAELAEAFAAGLVARVVEAAREWRAARDADASAITPGRGYANGDAFTLIDGKQQMSGRVLRLRSIRLNGGVATSGQAAEASLLAALADLD